MISVYGDLFFLVNLVVDAILLISLGVLSRRRLHPGRLAAASLLAGAYSLVVLYTVPTWLASPPVVLLFPLLPLWIAFRPSSLSAVLRLLGWFYSLALVTGGLTYALNLWRAPGLKRLAPAPLPLPWWALGLSLVAVIGGAYGLWRYHESRRWALRPLATVTVTVEGRSRRFRALVDTGHELTDPLSGRPVLVAATEAVTPLLPPALRCRGLTAGDADIRRVFAALSQTPFARRLRIVPFVTVGGAESGLIAFVSDTVAVESGGQAITHRRVLVALTASLPSAGRYEALLPPEFAAGDRPADDSTAPAPVTDTGPSPSLGRS